MKAARVAVQFESITEKLSPHDTIFSFTQSEDLRDSTLSSACSLHTATASIQSSNDSLPLRGLAGISEDVSELRVAVVEGRAEGEEQSWGPVDAPTRLEKVNGITSAVLSRHGSASSTTQGSFRQRTSSNTDKPLPAPPPPEDHTQESTSPGSNLHHGDYNVRPSMDGRFSSNSIRPSTRDLYDAYGYRKKVKVGPRPSTDSVGASNNLDPWANELRPVSTLPAGLRMPSRKAVPTGTASRQAQASSPTRNNPLLQPSLPAQVNTLGHVTPKKAPTALVASPLMPDRNLSVSSNGLRTPKVQEPGSPKMTPEKRRLMKALQLRQKQSAARNFVNSIEIKSVSEDLGFSKAEIDDSVLSAVFKASTSTEEPAPVQIATKDIAKEDSRHLEDSPISMPETAEEPSTQASSITDEEEAVVHKRQDNYPTLTPSVPEHEDSLSDILAETSQPQLFGRLEAAPEHFRKNALPKAASMESLDDPSQPSALTQPLSFVAYEDVIAHNAVGNALPKSERHSHSSVTDGNYPDEKKVAMAEGIDEDKGFSSGLPLDGYEGYDQSAADDHPLLVDRRIMSTPEIHENSSFQQSEQLEIHDKAADMGETSGSEDFPQSKFVAYDERGYSIPNPDDHARVLLTQLVQSPRQSVEHRSQIPDRCVPGEDRRDISKPLLVGRSSSSNPVSVTPDSINAHEVPLPPIDEDEISSLSPQRTLFGEQAATPPQPEIVGESKAATGQAKLLSEDCNHSVRRSSTSNGVGERQTGRDYLGQGVIKSIRRVSSPDRSDEHFLSDDSFMEELKSATVQEAKPVSVSKSPIKPVFSRSESEQRLNGSTRDSRSVSTPVNRSAKDEEFLSSPRLPALVSTSRSVSAQHAPRPDSQHSQVPISKKIGVSSSISQRIKALEQLSSRPTSPVPSNLAPNPSTFLGLRKASIRTPSAASDYKNSNFQKSHRGTAHPSPSPSPGTVESSLFNLSNGSDHSRPIHSVSATIARDARDKSPAPNPPEARHLELRESPRQSERQKSPPPAEHKPMGPPPPSPLKPPRPRFGRYPSTRSGSSSSNEQKPEPLPATRRDSFASIRSKSSRAGSEIDLPRTLSDSSVSGVASLDGTQDEKKDSRRSRLLKRMSSISSMSRRSIAHALSPGPKEAPIIERQEPLQEAPSPPVDMGDVNVQFPDNLVNPTFTPCLTSADAFSSYGKDDTWPSMRTASWSCRHPNQIV